MIEHSHLKIIHALHNEGTLTQAATVLHLSQSALSHQIRYLEKKLDIQLWEKTGRKLRLTPAGQLLLQTAEQVLPVLQQTEQTLTAFAQGKQGILRLGVECYPCYQWLTSVMGEFLQQCEVDIDIINQFQFSGLEGLLNHHIDVLVTPDYVKNDKIHYQTLASYDMVLVMTKTHPLAQAQTLQPEMLADQTLLTFPVPVARLDIMSQFLIPARVQPAQHKTIASLDIMLQMTALQRGVCVLPEWLFEQQANDNLATIPIGKGMHKQLFLALRQQDVNILYIQQFIEVAKTTASRSFVVA